MAGPQEITFEKLAFALETTRGTAIATPTHFIPAKGKMTPQYAFYESAAPVGVFDDILRDVAVHSWATWETDDFELDANIFPALANRFAKGGVTAPLAGFVSSGVSGLPITTGTKSADGTGYGDTGTAVLSSLTGLTGAVIVPRFSGGALVSVHILDPGVGCTVASGSCTITGGGGSGASFTANIVSGGVQSISNIVAGSGYVTSPTVNQVGGTGSGLSAFASILTGKVDKIIIVTGGSYTVLPTGTIAGNPGGSGGTCTFSQLIYGTALTRLWEFIPTTTSDNLKSATDFWGDPNLIIHQSAYSMVDEYSISAENGEAATTNKISGMGRFPLQIGSPAFPAVALGGLIVPGNMQLWIDTTSPIGTTAVTGRLVSVEHTIPTGVSYKYVSQGPGGVVSFDHTGRNKFHIETKIVLEVVDMTQFDLFKNQTALKVRVRHNGPLIETVSGQSFYEYVEVDTYGKFRLDDWGEFEDTNRTLELTVKSTYNPTLGASWRVACQNSRSIL